MSLEESMLALARGENDALESIYLKMKMQCSHCVFL